MDHTEFIRYLACKKALDDRSLNARVWQAAVSRLQPSARVLELGGGIGTMAQRAAADPRCRPGSWTLVDVEADLIAEARRRVRGSLPFEVRFEAREAEAFTASCRERFELIIGHAVLDLLDAPSLLPSLYRLAQPGGRLLFSITFDGLTAFEPPVDADLDERILEAYHRTMDERLVRGKPSGDSRCGRHLLTLLPKCGFLLEDAGASDWIVFPRDGAYPPGEAEVLSFILGFVEESLSSRPEVDPGDFSRWLQRRRAQLADGSLVFLSHQLDVLASRPTA